MTKFEISNQVSGASLGIFEAADEASALEAMAHDAGYDSLDECVRVAAGDFADDDAIDRARSELTVTVAFDGDTARRRVGGTFGS